MDISWFPCKKLFDCKLIRKIKQKQKFFQTISLRKKCPYSELFWSASVPYSVQMRENADQNNSNYEHFLRSDLKVLTFHISFANIR